MKVKPAANCLFVNVKTMEVNGYMYGPMRLTGLASGMDIEQMINSMMKVQNMKVDRLHQDRQILQWQQEDYRGINALMLSFKNLTFDMRLQGTLMKNDVFINEESMVDITAGATAREGGYTLKVNALAEQALIQSTGSISKTLKGEALGETIGIDATNNEFKIVLEGMEKTITIDEGEYSIEELAVALQHGVDASFGDERISVGTEDGRLIFQPAGDYKPRLVLKSAAENDGLENLGFKNGDTFKIDPNASMKSIAGKFATDPFADDDGLIAFKINGQEFVYDFSDEGADSGKTLNNILNDINKNEKANVEAYYDSLTDRVIIKSKDYGIGARVAIENIEGNLFGDDGALRISDNETSYGRDAQIELNGVTIYKDSNKFTIEGLNLSLKDTFKETIKIEVSKDTEGALDAIKNFVEEYNKLIDNINSKLYEEKFRDYLPYTDEQRKELSDKEAELWEEKARSGLLRNDPVLSTIVSDLRGVLYQRVGDTGSIYSTLASIGIKTGDYKELGKLHINEDKLREALDNDLEGVVNLFGQSSKTDDKKGLALRLYDAAGKNIERLSKKAGSSASITTYDDSFIGERIRDTDKRLDNMTDYLTRVETRYWQQFTAMEKALDQMNSQSMWLTQQLTFWGN